MFSRPPVDILPFKFEFLSTLDKIIFFKLKVEILGIYDFNKAAAPATCGAAIEVPFNGLYPPYKSRLNISVPGAAISTLSTP